jgi:hypothetical protein
VSRKHRVTSADRRRAGVFLEVLVEEESACEALKPLLRRMLEGKGIRIGIRQFRGKPDLLGNLSHRFDGYAAARRRGDDIRVVVLVDQDQDDCRKLKERLDSIAVQSGLRPRSRRKDDGNFQVLNRIAVRELESWYFGDWSAVQVAFPKVLKEPPRAYRGNPDQLAGKCSDVFERVLRAEGVRITSKPEWARRIGPLLQPERNRSPSFQAFVSGVQDIVS